MTQLCCCSQNLGVPSSYCLLVMGFTYQTGAQWGVERKHYLVPFSCAQEKQVLQEDT